MWLAKQTLIDLNIFVIENQYPRLMNGKVYEFLKTTRKNSRF